MNTIKQNRIIKKSPLSLSLYSALCASFFLFGCGGGSGDPSDNGNVPENIDSETKEFISLSCVSPDIDEENDRFVAFDMPDIMDEIERESEQPDTVDAAFISVQLGLYTAGFSASQLAYPLLYCDKERALLNNCSDNIDLGGEAVASTKGTGMVENNWLSFDVYQGNKNTLEEIKTLAFNAESPHFWNGTMTAFDTENSSTIEVQWSRNNAGDEHYLEESSDGGYIEFFENADCSGTMKSLTPDIESLEISWSATIGDAVTAVSGEYTICYLNKDPVKCVSNDFHVGN